MRKGQRTSNNEDSIVFSQIKDYLKIISHLNLILVFAYFILSTENKSFLPLNVLDSNTFNSKTL